MLPDGLTFSEPEAHIPARPHIALLFPPQWSPFQPPLGLPALSGHLKSRGFRTRVFDLNVLFYHWLLSEEGARSVIRAAVERDSRLDRFSETLTVVRAHRVFETAVRELLQLRRSPSVSVFASHWLGLRALETYCEAVSDVSRGSFRITPYQLELDAGVRSRREIEDAIGSPPPVLRDFAQWCAQRVLRDNPRSVGLSCIGQTQLFFSLLIGKTIRRIAPEVPILVGGTVLPRIHERHGIEPHWFGQYFDVVVRHEGEQPLARFVSLLHEGETDFAQIEGVIVAGPHGIQTTDPAPPLNTDDIVDPDFDDLDLDLYLSPSPTLPLLASRGCYWGKCEFCHHGMVYGDKYSAQPVERVIETITRLSARYGVSHFAFNDEALPPKTFRQLGQLLPRCDESGWRFTGLIKFERYYEHEDFRNAHDAGFRSLYVGLESASERVLRRMKKLTPLDDIRRNLADAADAGIWMHCFIFFGFPGERPDEAQQTLDFVISNADTIGSFGAGIFELEHNAPIQNRAGEFGVTLSVERNEDLSVYYDFAVEDGVSPAMARTYVKSADAQALRIPKFRVVQAIPREHLLSILDAHPGVELERYGRQMLEAGGVPAELPLSSLVHWDREQGRLITIATGRISEVDSDHATIDTLLNASLTYGEARNVLSRAGLLSLLGAQDLE